MPGTDLQVPGAGDRIFDVEHGAEIMADLFAILHRDQASVGAVGHHLHGRAFASEHGDAHKLEAHGFQARCDDGGQFGLHLAGAGSSSEGSFRSSKTKKAAG